jgi:hypothetical protein
MKRRCRLVEWTMISFVSGVCCTMELKDTKLHKHCQELLLMLHESIRNEYRGGDERR